MAERVNDLLLPIVKGVGSERSYELLATSLQTFGGSGFLQDYPIEQYIRDAKIDSLYEGTTAIQAQDFFFRKIVRDQSGRDEPRRTDQGVRHRRRGRLAGARERASGPTRSTTAGDRRRAGRLVIAAGGVSPRAVQGRPEHHPPAHDVGDLVVGYLLLKQAEVAEKALADGASTRDVPFYEGKIAAAKFFAANVLPRLASERKWSRRGPVSDGSA